MREPKVIATNYGYRCEYFKSVLGGHEFVWYEGNELMMRANAYGIMLPATRTLNRSLAREIVDLANFALDVNEKLDGLGPNDDVESVIQFIKDHEKETVR